MPRSLMVLLILTACATAQPNQISEKEYEMVYKVPALDSVANVEHSLDHESRKVCPSGYKKMTETFRPERFGVHTWTIECL